MNRCERCAKDLVSGERLTSVEITFDDYHEGAITDKRQLHADVCATCFEDMESIITRALRVRSMFPGAIGRASADAEPAR